MIRLFKNQHVEVYQTKIVLFTPRCINVKEKLLWDLLGNDIIQNEILVD
jgi:hypothetical protein